MLAKINVIKVLRDHISTFRDIDNNNMEWLELSFFFLLPIAFGIAGVFLLDFTITREILNTLIASLSVVVALLFNLLLLVYDIISKSDTVSSTPELKCKFLRQIYSNISYSILLSIISVFFMVIFFFLLPSTNAPTPTPASWPPPASIFTKILSVLNLSLLTNFAFTLLMILKRVHILLSKEMNTPKFNSAQAGSIK